MKNVHVKYFAHEITSNLSVLAVLLVAIERINCRGITNDSRHNKVQFAARNSYRPEESNWSHRAGARDAKARRCDRLAEIYSGPLAYTGLIFVLCKYAKGERSFNMCKHTFSRFVRHCTRRMSTVLARHYLRYRPIDHCAPWITSIIQTGKNEKNPRSERTN